MPELPEGLKTIPPAGWAAIIGGGAIAAWYLNNKSKAAAAAAAAAPATPGSSLTSGGTLQAGGVVLLPSGTAAPGDFTNVPTAGPVQPAITSNEDWLRAVESPLLAKGYDPSLVDNALRKYLEGDPLTANEQAVVNQALLLQGPPPNPVPVAPPATPAPTPTPTPTAPNIPAPVFYPQNAPVSTLPAGVNPCPAGYVLEIGATGWTCATSAQHDALLALLAGSH